jgi:outer membrane protein
MNFLSKIFFFTYLIFSTNALSHDLVAYVDLDYLLKNSKSGKSIVLKLNDINTNNIKKIKDRELILKKNEKDLLKNKNVISNEVFNQKLEKLKNEIEIFRKDNFKIRQSLDELKQKELNNFLKNLEPLLSTYMKENSIDILLDKKNVFIGRVENDITKNLLKIVDENIN